MLYIKEPFKSAWRSKDAFAEVRRVCRQANKENIFRDKEGRRTVRFDFQNKSYFLKHHSGVGWKEIIKNLIQLRLPVLGASNEFYAAKKLKELGVDTLTPLAYGKKGANPASQESFLITEDLVETSSLEDYCRDWPQRPPAIKTKQALIKKVSQAARLMHESGMNHRDFYICHFLLEKLAEQKIIDNNNFCCYLIDLHRCQIRSRVPGRWLVKDLGGLLYSTLDVGLSKKDYFLFVKHYTDKPLKAALQDPCWQAVQDNAARLYEKDFGRKPLEIFGEKP